MDGVGCGGWREWDVEYVKNVENVEIKKGQDAVKGIPSF